MLELLARETLIYVLLGALAGVDWKDVVEKKGDK